MPTDHPTLHEPTRESLARLIEMIPAGVVVVTGGRIICNRIVEELTGYRQDEIGTVDEWVTRLHEPGVSPFAPSQGGDTAPSGTPAARAYRITTKDGSERWLEFSSTGNDPAIFLITDVTRRHTEICSLRTSEERYRRFSALTSDYVYACRRRGSAPYRVEWLGGAIETITGYPADEILRMGCWLPLVHPDDRERIAHHLISLTPGSIGTEKFRIVRKDGEIRWIQERCRCEEGDAPGELLLYGTSQDITDRVTAEEKLRKNEWLLREAHRIGHLGCYDYDVLNDTWESSPEMNLIFGIPADYPKTFGTWLDLIDPDHRERMKNYFQSLLVRKEWFDMEYPVIRPSDGSRRWLYGTGEFTLDDAGNPVRMIGTIQDITERKEAEEELKRLNAGLDLRVKERTAQLEEMVRELESFSYSVSHDLRAPLRHINSYGAMLEEELGDSLPPDARHCLNRIRNATNRMGNLIDALLDLSRVGRCRLRFEPVDLGAVAKRIVETLREAEPHRQAEFIIEGEVIVRGDRTLLCSVMENLIGNAWKFSSVRDVTRIEFGKTVAGGETVFFVRDNGPGFDMAHSSKLFEAFHRLHGEEFAGTGIGLATVKRIIERHRGRIWAESRPDGGATFFFTLAPPETPD